MVDARSLRRRGLACGVAVVLALTAAAFLVASVRDRETARRELARATGELRVQRSASSSDARLLNRSRHAVQSIEQQLNGITSGGATLAKLDNQDLDTVRAAVQAGQAGTLADYNAAVDQRAALDTEHDTTLEQVRQQANTVISVLDLLSG